MKTVSIPSSLTQGAQISNWISRFTESIVIKVLEPRSTDAIVKLAKTNRLFIREYVNHTDIILDDMVMGTVYKPEVIDDEWCIRYHITA